MDTTSLDAPSGVMLTITNRCNLHCIHCYNSSNARDNNIDVEENKWNNILQNVLKYDIKRIEITGGEPLIRKDLVKSLLEQVRNKEKISIQINSNGFYIDDAILDYFETFNNTKTIQISLDGHNTDICTRIRGNRLAWEYAVDAIKKTVKRSSIETVVVHTINKYNVNYIEEFYGFLSTSGIDRLVIGAALPMGRAENPIKQFILSYEERLQLLYKLYKLKSKYQISFSSLVTSAGGVMDIITYLRDVENWLIIDSNGDVRISCRMPYIVGNAFRDSIIDIWEKLLKYQKSDRIIDMIIEDIGKTGDLGYSKKTLL